MRLPDEMKRLGEELREAYESRREAHTARMDAVAGLLEKHHTVHEEMAAALRRQLGEATTTRRAAEEHRRAVMGSMLRETESGMADAHEVWAEFGRLLRQARFGLSGPPTAVRPMPTKKGRLSRRRASQ